MTELEKMERARMYLEKLTNGINPLDDMPVAENDIVRNARIARCMQYVTEVLQQVIDNGGITPYTPGYRVPFAINREQLAKYQASEYPIPISEVTGRINSLINPAEMRNLSHQSVTAWLVEQNLLYVITQPNGRTSKRPTEYGRRLGISEEQRTGMNGDYVSILYDSNAQIYIINNLQAIIDKHNEKRLQRSAPQP
ncbi:MAG: hypothetical protein IJP32_12360 [Clostridia bacterium]|nr:hypothetical protein [Clostridia bacterium]MBQ9997161.1 hypothetical protein [Clostridia bacterium]